MTDTEPQVNIALTNYPPEGGDLQMRTILFGGGTTLKLLLEMDSNDEGTEMDIALTLDVGAAHSEISLFLDDAIQILETIRDSAQPQIDEAIEELT